MNSFVQILTNVTAIRAQSMELVLMELETLLVIASLVSQEVFVM